MFTHATQVKKFGLIGRTKYTHLMDQDTTQVSGSSTLLSDFVLTRQRQKDAAWNQKTVVSAKLQNKLGGLKQEFVRPATKRKRDN